MGSRGKMESRGNHREGLAVAVTRYCFPQSGLALNNAAWFWFVLPTHKTGLPTEATMSRVCSVRWTLNLLDAGICSVACIGVDWAGVNPCIKSPISTFGKDPILPPSLPNTLRLFTLKCNLLRQNYRILMRINMFAI